MYERNKKKERNKPAKNSTTVTTTNTHNLNTCFFLRLYCFSILYLNLFKNREVKQKKRNNNSNISILEPLKFYQQCRIKWAKKKWMIAQISPCNRFPFRLLWRLPFELFLGKSCTIVNHTQAIFHGVFVYFISLCFFRFGSSSSSLDRIICRSWQRYWHISIQSKYYDSRTQHCVHGQKHTEKKK